METQNIMLSILKEILLEVKLLAAKCWTRACGLLAQISRMQGQQKDAYAHARQRHMQRHMQRLEQGIDLGTDGRIKIRRQELHERD